MKRINLPQLLAYLLIVVVALGGYFQLEQQKGDIEARNAQLKAGVDALADQVRSLGAAPVVDAPASIPGDNNGVILVPVPGPPGPPGAPGVPGVGVPGAPGAPGAPGSADDGTDGRDGRDGRPGADASPFPSPLPVPSPSPSPSPSPVPFPSPSPVPSPSPSPSPSPIDVLPL